MSNVVQFPARFVVYRKTDRGLVEALRWQSRDDAERHARVIGGVALELPAAWLEVKAK